MNRDALYKVWFIGFILSLIIDVAFVITLAIIVVKYNLGIGFANTFSIILGVVTVVVNVLELVLTFVYLKFREN